MSETVRQDLMQFIQNRPLNGFGPVVRRGEPTSLAEDWFVDEMLAKQLPWFSNRITQQEFFRTVYRSVRNSLIKVQVHFDIRAHPNSTVEMATNICISMTKDIYRMIEKAQEIYEERAA